MSRSLLRHGFDESMGVLNLLGNTLNKPSRALWGTLKGITGGEDFGGGLLNLVPFSDTMGWTDPDKGVEASDFLTHVGVMPENKKGFDAWDIPRFAADIAGDPTTYLTLGGGALTKAGLKAAKTGTLTKGIGAGIRAEEKALARFGAFGKYRHFGTGEKAARVGDKVDAGVKAVSESPPGVFAQRLFSHRAGGQSTAAGQRLSKAAIDLEDKARIKAARRAQRLQGSHNQARQILRDLYGDMDVGEVVLDTKGNPMVVDRNLHLANAADANLKRLEGPTDSIQPVKERRVFAQLSPSEYGFKMMPTDQITKKTPGATMTGHMIDQRRERLFSDILRFTTEKGNFDNLAKKFLNGEKIPPAYARQIEDLITDLRKQNRMTKLRHDDVGGMQGMLDEDLLGFGPRRASRKSAAEAKLDTPMVSTHGTGSRREAIRDVSADVVRDMKLDANVRKSAQHVFDTYERQLRHFTYKDGEKVFATTQAEVNNFKMKHAEQLRDYFSGKSRREDFTNDFLDDNLNYQNTMNRQIHTMQATTDMLLDPTSHKADGLPLAQAYESIGMHPERAKAYAARLMKKRGDARNIDDILVDPDLVHAAGSLMRVSTRPGDLSDVGRAIDAINRVFKDALTIVHPAFAGRNLLSGQFVNLSTGIVNGKQDLRDYIKVAVNAAKQMKNPTDELLHELDLTGLVDYRSGFMDIDMLKNPGQHAPKPLMKGAVKDAKLKVFESPLPLKIDKIPGMRQAREVYGTAKEMGARLNQQVEWMNRVAPYMYLRKKGHSMAEAARKVKDMHFDYSELAPFEKAFMRRAFLFYTFARKMAPLTLKTLADRPGGVLAQTIRAQKDFQSTDEMLPEYIRNTLAVPLGGEDEEGNQRYLTGFGLAHEDTASLVGPGAGLEALSRLHPVIKGPLEYATGRLFFQGGRDLRDADPTIGRLFANARDAYQGAEGPTEPVQTNRLFEHVVANSPFSRFATTARQTTDRRRGLAEKIVTLLTGFRTHVVSPAARDAVLRDFAQELMRDQGAKAFERVYFPKSLLNKMQPEERQAAERLQEIMNELAARAKARKKERNAT